MSWKASAHVKEQTHAPNGKKLTRSEKFLMLILADYYNDEQQAAWPSIPRLAKDALMSERQARRVIHSLEKKQVLLVSRRAPKPNFYRFTGLLKPPLVEPDPDILSPSDPDTMSPPDPDIADPNPDISTPDPDTLTPSDPDISAPDPDIAVSPEPSCQPSVSEPPIATVSQSSLANGFQILTDHLGRTYYKPPPKPQRSDPDSTDGKHSRWTLKDDDSDEYKVSDVLTAYTKLTGNPLSKSDREIAEILGSYGRFSSAAVVELMQTIESRAKGKINSMGYFRAGVNEIARRCESAVLTASTMTTGATPQKKREIELRAVRREVHQWQERGAA